ncbi:MAG: MarR family transcriptional regulator [Saprospiraceae bacterium]|nr:MarR family transcriptional regulator [Saprospiraceae bacterium]
MNYTDILIQVRKIVRTINLESKRIEKKYGISIPQLLCLNFLNSRESFQATPSEIKNFLNLNASSVTSILSRLESKGYIARLPNRKDKRVGLISITAKGEKLLEDTPEPLHEQLSQKLKELSPSQLTELQQSFDVIIDFLNIDESGKIAPIITAQTDIPSSK